MAATISAVTNSNPNSTGAVLTMGGLGPYAGSKMVVTRTDQLGQLTPVNVRGADQTNIIGSTMTVTDYEIPINILCRYELKIYTGGTLVASGIFSSYVQVDTTNPIYTAPYNNFWINDVTNPTLSLPVLVEDFDDVAFSPSILGEFKPLGRKNPVLFTDVWGAREGTFEIDSLSLNNVQKTMQQIEALLTSGDVLLFQSGILPYTIRDMYFVVKGLDRSIVGGLTPGVLPSVRYTIQFQEVDIPPTTGITFGLGTWGQLRDDPGSSAVSWTTVQSAFASWNSVLNYYSS